MCVTCSAVVTAEESANNPLATGYKFWLNVDTDISWDKLINALERIGQISLAEKIRNGKIFIIY